MPGRACSPAGHVEASLERDNHERAVELVRGVLGEAAYAAACAEGDGLTLEEAAALVDAYRD